MSTSLWIATYADEVVITKYNENVMGWNISLFAMNTLETRLTKRAEILKLATEHGAANVRVFGSIVRGEDTADSDIDFLVDMKEGRTLYDLIGFQQDVEKVLGRHVDVLTPGGINRYLKDQILNEARLL